MCTSRLHVSKYGCGQYCLDECCGFVFLDCLHVQKWGLLLLYCYIVMFCLLPVALHGLKNSCCVAVTVFMTSFCLRVCKSDHFIGFNKSHQRTAVENKPSG